ncbi:MAG: hypothetical protein IJK44_07155 [Bacteroidales bacterium]|nr:hypothetical protein [Bacteroidales bacterium]
MPVVISLCQHVLHRMLTFIWRKEVIEAENNPDLYQVEDPSSNRSHKYE